MKRRPTTLKGESVNHPLALAVYNDSQHYQDRVRNYSVMNQRHYRTYLLGLVNAHATTERRQFGVRHKPTDIDIAVEELHTAMKRHVDEWKALQAVDPTVTPLPVA